MSYIRVSIKILLISTIFFNACGEESSRRSDVKYEGSNSEVSEATGLKSDDLRRAALDGNFEVVRKAWEQGVDINATDQLERTALMFASFNGHSEIISFLLNKGAQLSQKDTKGRSSLMFAASGPFPESVKLLLVEGADPNVTDSVEGWSSLMYAAAEGNEEVVALLLKHGADVSMKDNDGDTAIDFAKNNGHSEVVTLLEN